MGRFGCGSKREWWALYHLILLRVHIKLLDIDVHGCNFARHFTWGLLFFWQQP